MLDPPTFSGGNTTYESLAAHIPTITLPSPYLRGRLTHALYSQLNFRDCTATTEEDYITKATTIATDPTLRAELRTQLADLTPRLYHNLDAVRELESLFLNLIKK